MLPARQKITAASCNLVRASKSKNKWATWLIRLSVMPFIFVAVLFSVSLAQTESGTDRPAIEQRKSNLEAIEAKLAGASAEDLLSLRTEVRRIRAEALSAAPEIEERRDRLSAEIEALGPAPAEGADAESAEVSAERARLAELLSGAEFLFRQSQLNLERAAALLNEIAKTRRAIFYDGILTRSASPLNPAIFGSGIAGFLGGVQSSIIWGFQELAAREKAQSLTRDMIIVGASFLLALILFVPVRRYLNRFIAEFMDSPSPSVARQVAAAAGIALARSIPAVLGGFVILQALRAIDFLGVSGGEQAQLAGTIWLGAVCLLIADGAATSVFAQTKIGWRLIPLTTARGAAVRGLIVLAAAILLIDATLIAGSSIVGAPQETTLLQSAIVAIALAVVLFLITRRGLWRLPIDLNPDRATHLTGRWSSVPVTGTLIALFVIAAAVIGYVPLAYFAATRIFFLLGLLGGAICLRSVLKGALEYIVRLTTPADASEADTSVRSLVVFWLGLLLDIAVFAAFLAPAFLILGAEWADVRDAVIDAFFGFQIGSVTVSIADILAGVAVFMAILWTTKAIQTAVEARLFPQTKLDPGVKHSFRTLIGYAGFILAVLAAIGAVGADLSSLAIVAGALSVGIGFGLQSVVSNFVSGLILLFERPIKVGDWIVTASGQGFVKRISVRSTEIETFDKSSVIVPNSELIANTVTNLTLGDKMGRLIIPIGASYESDPEAVIAVLEDIAANHPQVLKTPEPFVLFSGLGESSIDFELRVFVSDIAGGIRVTNQLRLQAFKRFREAGIEIPFPQRDLHLRSAVPLEIRSPAQGN